MSWELEAMWSQTDDPRLSLVFLSMVHAHVHHVHHMFPSSLALS